MTVIAMTIMVANIQKLFTTKKLNTDYFCKHDSFGYLYCSNSKPCTPLKPIKYYLQTIYLYISQLNLYRINNTFKDDFLLIFTLLRTSFCSFIHF